MPTIQLRTRVDRELKRKSDAVLKSLGLDAGTFVSMAMTQLVNRRGLPFAVTEPDDAYFATEYGLTRAEAATAGRRMRTETARARKAGELKVIAGPEDL